MSDKEVKNKKTETVNAGEKKTPEVKDEVPKINVHAFSNLHGLSLSKEARLFHAVAIGNIESENTVAGWEKVLLAL